MRLRALALLGAIATAAVAGPPPPGAIQIEPKDVAWRPAGGPLPAEARVAVLEGDPRRAGVFTQRVLLPAGTRIEPHWHPRPERVTVLSGAVGVGFGERVDPAALKRLGPRSFYVNPPHSHHYIVVLEDAIVQITGEGPWELHFIRPTPK